MTTDNDVIGKGKMICRVGNFAVFMESYGQAPVFLAVITDDKGDILASTQLDLTLAVFLERCLGSAISEILGHAVQENWYGENEES